MTYSARDEARNLAPCTCSPYPGYAGGQHTAWCKSQFQPAIESALLAARRDMKERAAEVADRELLPMCADQETVNPIVRAIAATIRALGDGE